MNIWFQYFFPFGYHITIVRLTKSSNRSKKKNNYKNILYTVSVKIHPLLQFIIMESSIHQTNFSEPFKKKILSKIAMLTYNLCAINQVQNVRFKYNKLFCSLMLSINCSTMPNCVLLLHRKRKQVKPQHKKETPALAKTTFCTL